MQVHFFAEALEGAYGVIAYIRVYNICGKVSCNFLISEARLAPIKSMSIPKLEATTVGKVLGQYLQCRKNAPAGKQFMSKLFKCRLMPSKPTFYFSVVQ